MCAGGGGPRDLLAREELLARSCSLARLGALGHMRVAACALRVLDAVASRKKKQ